VNVVARSWDGLGLDAFVPALLRRRIGERSPAHIQPAAERLRAALLIADLSGFTALAEAYSRRGPRGAEDLRDVLNFYCGHLIDLVESHGGEFFRFAGDEAIAFWVDEGLGTVSAVTGAARCAIAAQQSFAMASPPNDARLSLRMGIGLGDLWVATLGGTSGRWEFLVAGDPLTEAVGAMAAIAPGETGVSSSAWHHLAAHASGVPVSDASVRLASMSPGAAAPSPFTAPSPVADELLRAYVPRSVQARLDARQPDWLAEFRRATVLLVKLEGFDHGSSDALDRFQRAAVAVQQAIYRYGGTINQLLVDDKGTVAMCGWGLALHAHGDDQTRAVRAALELQRALREAGFRGAFGLATGEVFTGLLGTARRCAFALIGDVVNVAARLMQAADDEVLCDRMTFEAASKRVAFEPLQPLHVKGREQAVAVFRPTHLSAAGSADLFGRAVERRRLAERLDTLAATARADGVIVLEGVPGIGKSRLVADLVDRAAAQGVRALTISGDAIEHAAPYHAWEAVFDRLLGLDGTVSPRAVERRVIDALVEKSDLVAHAWLLNPVLRLSFDEPEESRNLLPRARAALTRELLVHLLRETAGTGPMLLVAEDAHWLDFSSWELAEGVAQQLPNVQLVIVTRPLTPAEQPAELRRMLEIAATLLLKLDVLPADDARALACQRLHARSLDEEVARVVHERAEGHPFFVEQLAYSLRDSGLVHTDDGICRFAGPSEAARSLQVPNSIQVVVISRIDQLAVAHQQTLKIASVFGRAFDLEGLHAIYPIDGKGDDLQAHIDALIERGLVRHSSDAQRAAYEFQHAITQEVAYGILPFALRRQLHAACARWYEDRHAANLAPFYLLLAHHWSRADMPAPALMYTEKAGEQAFARHANEEAIRFFEQAIAIDEQLKNVPDTDPPVALTPRRQISGRDARRLRWQRQLGDAAINLGQWDRGREHFERALSFAGFPLPISDRAWIRGLGRETLVQCGLRVAPRRAAPSSPAAQELLREIVRAYGRVGASAYHYDRIVQVLYCVVAALNVGERIGPTRELALAYADVGNLLGLSSFGPGARFYHRLATQTAEQLNDARFAARLRGRLAVYHLGGGNWQICRDLDGAMEACDLIGDTYGWEENAAIRARAAQLTGQFELAARLGSTLRTRAATTGSSAHELWGFGNESWGLLQQGEYNAALDLAERGLKLVSAAGRPDRLALLDLLGAKALAHVNRREWPHARTAAQRIVDVLVKSPRPRYFAVLYMSAAAETFLTLQEIDPSNAASECETRIRYLCRQLALYAKINPPARARWLLWEGCAEWLRRDPRRAFRLWHRALAEARRFELPYETARVLYEMGRRLDQADPERRVHLTAAADGFRQLNAQEEWKRALAAVEPTDAAHVGL
jgi:class 3 adenylate cyclase